MKLTKLEIIENAKAIMLFMGLTPQFELTTKYHKSWDALLPVYVKAAKTIVPLYKGNRKINVKASNHVIITRGYLLSGDFDKTYENLVIAIKDFVELMQTYPEINN